MSKIVIFGNSGSGKSTFANALVEQQGLAHLDLDTVAWKPVMPPQRESLEVSHEAIKAFTQVHSSWVIEGCYADLLELVLEQAEQLIYLNLPVELCMENARQRPWEPHKYESKEAQDANLAMLLDWIGQYQKRQDTFSQLAHQKLFDEFSGNKTMYTSNQRN